MTIVLNGTTGITNDGGYTGDGVVFADTTPANTLVTTTGGNVGIGTSSPNRAVSIYRASSPVLQLIDATTGTTSNDGLLIQQVGVDTYIENAEIGFMQFRTSGTERARIDASGVVLINGTSTAYSAQFAVFGNSDGANNPMSVVQNAAGSTSRTSIGFFRGATGVGFITTTNTATSYGTSSDYRLKHDIQPMTGALAKVAALKPVTYKWNADDSNGEGFIAHELQEVCPSAVTGEKDAVETYTDENGVEQTRPKYQGIDTSFLVATLTAAIQEQQAIITAQAAQIQQLREKVLEVEEGTSNMLVENTNNLYETITALTARVAALEGK